MENDIRLRFAPSPTGGLHIGGVRTALFTYLFTKQNRGRFILRIEDTDQSRFVDEAEDYIIQALKWSGIIFDEGPHLVQTDFGPYRQSERKYIYHKYAHELVKKNFAYYAFDTEEELSQLKSTSSSYNYHSRQKMNNSLLLSYEEIEKRIQKEPFVIRYKNEPHRKIVVDDIIRGAVVFDSNLNDDKILLKSDGMPTYHLAVVVDDYLMKISHVFRGEEWLPSAPIHVDLWHCFGWKSQMPKWVHLPLILSPSGEGKLSKREAKQLGFPTFPLQWFDQKTQETYEGFKETGFLPEAFVNILAFMGWKPKIEQEIFEFHDLIEQFDIGQVNKSSAKFDYEKACWINHQHIQSKDSSELVTYVKSYLPQRHKTTLTDKQLERMIRLLKDRCNLLSDFWQQGQFLFEAPKTYDLTSIELAWDDTKSDFFSRLSNQWKSNSVTAVNDIESSFKELAVSFGLKPGKLMLPLRIMIVGGKYGPAIFDILDFITLKEASSRIDQCLDNFSNS